MTAIAVLDSTGMDLVTYVARAPGRGGTATGRGFRTAPGGKGAARAVAAARSGDDVVMTGAVGTGAYGLLLRTSPEHAGADTELPPAVAGSGGAARIVGGDEGSDATVVVPGTDGAVTTLGPGGEAAVAAADLLPLQPEFPMAAVTEAVAWASAALRVRRPGAPAPMPCRGETDAA
ncbi:PfkB family carbohydrate kinase [Streptomyces sp. NPDC014623]|uniref:PfkB family carbohydrate kinase n=1 Tax=Streptomyces sp. NPDC014623 TaxID=3364875 RepID=UPI0036FD7C1A